MRPYLRSRGALWQSLLLSLFPAGDDVAVYKDYQPTYTAYTMLKHLYNNRYWRVRLGVANIAVGQNAAGLGPQDIVDVYKGLNDQSTPAVTHSGFAFTNSTQPGGRVMYGTSAGNWLQAALTNVTTVGVIIPKASADAGICVVSIDGDNTLADLLPTAQDLVDGGTLPATVLVANGGTLNPTDRCMNMYNQTLNYSNNYTGAGGTYVLFSSTLSLGNHTVRLTNTAYKPAGSSAAKTYAYLIMGTSTLTRASQGGFCFTMVVQNVDTDNTWDISYYFKPSGATTYAWLGHDNQAKVTAEITVTVDGTLTALSAWQEAHGSIISFYQEASIRHAEVGGGATNLGAYNATWTISKATGLTVSNSVTWAFAAGGLIQGYPCMMSVNHAIYDRFKTHSQAETDLTSNDNSVQLNSSDQAAWCWDFNGNQAAVMYIPSLANTVDGWVNTDASPRLFWMDISTGGGAWKKAYATRYRLVGSINSFSNGQVMLSECNYRVNWFPAGANAALAGRF